MKLVFGLMGASLLITFLMSIILKVQEVSLIVVAVVGVVMALIDLWQARNEADT